MISILTNFDDDDDDDHDDEMMTEMVMLLKKKGYEIWTLLTTMMYIDYEQCLGLSVKA